MCRRVSTPDGRARIRSEIHGTTIADGRGHDET
jgi:hypothetical protein